MHRYSIRDNPRQENMSFFEGGQQAMFVYCVSVKEEGQRPAQSVGHHITSRPTKEKERKRPHVL
jgi:hypothetical protein